MADDLPAPDQIEGAPHPRDTVQIYGHAGAEAEFLAAYNSGRLHSGWLLTGAKGVGKATLAYRIAAFLLAEQPDDGLFGAPPPAETLQIDREAPDMRQILARAHPRLFVLNRGPNSTGSALSDVITVDRVRKLKDFFHMSSADGGRRVVIVDAGDEMNNSAANALLKELEEPPERTTILLIAHQPSRLLPTIRSRCRVLRLSPLPPPDMAHALMQAEFETQDDESLAALSGGSVGDAVRLMQMGGLDLYHDLIKLFQGAPRIDRQAANALADSMVGKAADGRFLLALDLLDQFLARTARAGLHGPPALSAGPDESALLTRLSPTDLAARDWATLAETLRDKTRHGRAVNIDPGTMFLDAVFAIEATAQRHLT